MRRNGLGGRSDSGGLPSAIQSRHRLSKHDLLIDMDILTLPGPALEKWSGRDAKLSNLASCIHNIVIWSPTDPLSKFSLGSTLYLCDINRHYALGALSAHQLLRPLVLR